MKITISSSSSSKLCFDEPLGIGVTFCFSILLFSVVKLILCEVSTASSTLFVSFFFIENSGTSGISGWLVEVINSLSSPSEFEAILYLLMLG